jgi:putative colanic acid biosynthesis glycosyltransferase WcaI
MTIVNLYFPPDGSPTGRLAAELAAHRAHRGDKVTVVTSTAHYASGRRLQESIHEGITIYRVRTLRGSAATIAGRALQYAAFFAGAAWRLVRLPRQDLVICMSTPPFAGALGLLHRLLHRRVSLVLWNMDCYPEILEVCGLIKPGGAAARTCRRISRFILGRADHVVCPDEAMVDLLKAFHAPAGPRPSWSVVPNWEPRSRFPHPARVPDWEGRGRLGLGGRFVVLHLGNAGYGHDFRTLLRAAAELRGERVTFLFLGGGIEQARLKESAARSSLDNVLVHPYVPQEELASAAASADMGLVALAHGALGVMSPSKLHAYLGAGLPVLYLGPEGGNVDVAIRRFGCGLRVAQGDVPGLVAALRRALQDSGWLKDAGRRARRAFEEAYSDEAALPQLDRVIDGIALPAASPGDAGARAAA